MASAYAESSPLISSDHVKAVVTEFARGFNHSYYQPLHLAILKGDWESTKAFLDNDPTALTAKVTVYGRTALHVAAVGAQWNIVEKLVELEHMPANMLTELDFMGCTCLHYVAMGESINAVKALVAKNSSVTQVTDFKGFTPLIYSLTCTRCKEMVWHLLLNTTDERPGCPFSGPSASQLVALLTASGFHDITLHLLKRYPNLATISDSNGSIILNVLSKLPSHFPSGEEIGFLARWIYKCVHVDLEYISLNRSYFSGYSIWMVIQTLVPYERARDTKLRHVSAVRLVELVFSQAAMTDYQFWQSFVSPKIIFNATSSGIVEILKACFLFFPDLAWTHIPNEGYLVQIAIKNRQEKVFSFLRKMPIICKLLVLALDHESNNTTSHLAARFSPQVESISGASLQMETEIKWFKEVEKLDHPLHKEVKNKDGNTAWQVFKEEHKTLVKEETNWMKDRSNAGMLVATLIATITFAAAITVPGGNEQDTGTPTLLSNSKFRLFIAFDALAFLLSMTSLLLFLIAMTHRYTKKDLSDSSWIYLSVAVVATMITFAGALSFSLEENCNSIFFHFFIICIFITFSFIVLPTWDNMKKYAKT